MVDKNKRIAKSYQKNVCYLVEKIWM